MPLFMDRHDIRGSTAEEAAQAHHSDLEVQARHFCKALTYWYDGSRDKDGRVRQADGLVVKLETQEEIEKWNAINRNLE